MAEATASNPATTPGKDGNYADTTGYAPVNTPDQLVDPWRWQPVRVPLGDPNGTPQTPLTPQWGKVKPFDPKLLEGPSRRPTRST